MKESAAAPTCHTVRYRVGITCLVINRLCLLLLVLFIYPRYFMVDLFHALNLQWEITPRVILAVMGILALVTLIGSLAGQAKITPGKGSNAIAIFLFGIALYCLLYLFCGIFYHLVSEERRSYSRYSCINNLRDVTTAFMIYALDHNERLPDTWEEIESNVKDKTLLICPSTQRYFHRIGGYGYNANLCGKPLGSVQDPVKILLFSDAVHPQSYLTTMDDIDRMRHGYRTRGYNVAYLDGHVEFFTADAVVRLK